MNPIALSIIVPVYNVEAYLQACVESLITEEMASVEILLVDDGSTDRSSAICDAFADQYACVRCIHQENAGVSAARNAGLSEAKGRYILFVDSDDTVVQNGIASVLNWVNDADEDICFLQIQDLYPNSILKDHGDNIDLSEVRGKTKEEVLLHLATRPKYPGSAYAKAFRRDFLFENHIRFIKGRKNGEDLSFMMECLLAARRFDALGTPFYQYRRSRVGSATYEVDIQSYRQLCLFVTEWVERLTHGRKAKDQLSTYAMAFVAYEYAILLWRRVVLEPDVQKEADVFLQEYSWVLRYARNVRIKVIFILEKMLGIKHTSMLLKFIKSRGRTGV